MSCPKFIFYLLAVRELKILSLPSEHVVKRVLPYLLIFKLPPKMQCKLLRIHRSYYARYCSPYRRGSVVWFSTQPITHWVYWRKQDSSGQGHRLNVLNYIARWLPSSICLRQLYYQLLQISCTNFCGLSFADGASNSGSSVSSVRVGKGKLFFKNNCMKWFTKPIPGVCNSQSSWVRNS